MSHSFFHKTGRVFFGLIVAFAQLSTAHAAAGFGDEQIMTTTVHVPATGNLWLAGMPDGTPSHFGDIAPANSPVEVQGLSLAPGTSVFFSAEGVISHGPADDPLVQTSGPDGGTAVLSHDFGAENGISDIQAPVNALLGVFLGPDQPDSFPPPGAPDFSSPANQDYLSHSPELQQVFFIGDGLTSAGQLQEIVVPAGATRLFVGPMDASQFHNNQGAFTVTVSTTIQATLDVRPNKFPNRIEIEKNVCKDNDNLPVAILTTPEFNAIELVDATSLMMGDPALGGTAAPVHSQGRDIDRDGDKDVWLLFTLCDLVTNNALDHNSVELVLTGRTLEGGTFTARDSVEIIGRKPPASIVPVFDYPVDGQVLDYEGSYLFRVQPIASAEGFLWGFFQNGVMVWENYRDEGVLSGNEYAIHPGTVAHSRFVPGPVEVWVRASIKGQWTDAAVITIQLVPRSGSLDPTFGDEGKVTTAFGNDNDYGFAVAVQPDGRIVMAGTDRESRIDGTPIGHVNFALARYNSDGSLDTSFGVDGKVSTDFNNDDDFGADVAIQPDGKILVTGQSFLLHSGYLFGLARYNSDGTLDDTFDTDGKVTTAFGFGEDYGGEIALQPDGKIIVAGSSEQGGHWDIALARYNSDGSLDTTFHADGKVITDFSGRNDFGAAIVLQPDGRIVVAGRSEDGNNVDFALVRYNSDGSLDTTFDTDGIVISNFAKGDFGYDLALQPDGRIILAGATIINGSDFALVRYNDNGSLDPSFGMGGLVATDFGDVETGYAVVLQPDGRILLAGTSLNTNASIQGIVQQGGGGGSLDFALARYHSDGSLDATLDGDGLTETDFRGGDDEGRAMALQQDGKIIVAGYSHNGIDTDFALARYQVGASAQEVTIDIKPGSRTNHVNPNGRGRISVAILSTPEFDAYAMIDGTSLTFGRTGNENSLLECKGKGRDVNHDGLRDLICTFAIQAAGFQKGDTSGTLRGQTLGGISITGSDSIRVGRGSEGD